MKKLYAIVLFFPLMCSSILGSLRPTTVKNKLGQSFTFHGDGYASVVDPFDRDLGTYPVNNNDPFWYQDIQLEKIGDTTYVFVIKGLNGGGNGNSGPVEEDDDEEDGATSQDQFDTQDKGKTTKNETNALIDNYDYSEYLVNLEEEKEEEEEKIDPEEPTWQCCTCSTLNSVRKSYCLQCSKKRKIKIIAKKKLIDEEQDVEKMSKEEKARYLEKKTILGAIEQIEAGQKVIADYDNMTTKKVLIIGVTGSGKSTLINGLSNKPLICKEIIEVKKYKNHPITKKNKVIDVEGNTDIKIGHQQKSETTIPNFSFANGINFMDCPGFEDSRGNVEEIVNSFFINFLFKDKIKLLLLIPKSMLEADKQQKQFGYLVKKLRKILGSLEAYKDSMAIVVTKVSKEKKEIKEILKYSLMDYNDTKTQEKDRLTDSEIEMFMDIIESQRMHIFPTPQKIGPIDRGDIDYILKMLGECSFKKAEKVNIVVSSEAMNYVSEINIILNDDIFNTVNNICISIQNSIVNDICTIEYFTYLHDLIHHIEGIVAISDEKDIDTLVGGDDEDDEKEELTILQDSPLRQFKDKVKEHFLDKIDTFEPQELKESLQKYCMDFFTKASFLEFLYRINPNEQRNLKTEKWVNAFETTRKVVANDGISSIKKVFKRSLEQYLLKAIALLKKIKGHKNMLINTAYEERNFRQYNQFFLDFNTIAVFLQENNNKQKLESILKHINGFTNKYSIKNDLCENIKEILDYSAVLTKEGSVSQFEQHFLKEIVAMLTKLQKEFQSDKGQYLTVQKDTFIKDFIQLNKMIESEFKAIEDLNTLIPLLKSYSQVEKLTNTRVRGFHEITNDIRSIIKRYKLNCNMKNIDASERSLSDIFKIDPTLKTYKPKGSKHDNICVEIVDKMKIQLESTVKKVKNIYSNLEEKIKNSFEKEIESLITSFTKETLHDASNNVKINQTVSIELGILEKRIKNIENRPLDQVINILIKGLERHLSCDTLKRMLGALKILDNYPKRDRDAILRKDYWTEAIKSLQEGLANCKPMIMNIKLTNVIGVMEKMLEEKIRFEKNRTQSLDEFITKLDHIYYGFAGFKDLSNINYVNEMADYLYKIVNKVDQGDIKVIKAATDNPLFELSKAVDIGIDPDTKTKLFLLEQYVREERAWYMAWRNEICRNFFSLDYVYNHLKGETIDNRAFNNFLNMCGIDSKEFKAKTRRKEEVEKILETFTPSYRTYESNNEKVIVYGMNVKLSQVLHDYPRKRVIEIIAFHSVYIDKSIDKSRGLLGLSILSPNWYVVGSQTIDLSGADGSSHGLNYTTGKDGKPGKQGTSAGNFFGVIKNKNDYSKLTIKANGGQGGNGQDGGKGANGSDGIGWSSPEPFIDTYKPFYSIKDYVKCSCQRQHFVIKSKSGHGFNWHCCCDKPLIGSNYKYCKVSFKKYGYSGSRGGNGGRGGRGGRGGYRGITKIFDRNNKPVSNKLPPQDGKRGLDGNGGVGGKGGKNQCDVKCYYTYDKFSKWENMSEGYASDGETPSEKNGTQEPPASYEKYYDNMVESSKYSFNALSQSFEQNYKDPLCKLLIYQQVMDFNMEYVQKANR